MHRSLRERAELLDLADELGPRAPTRCEGWSTVDLIAHLRIREHRLDAAPGLLGKGPFAGHTAKVEASAARRPYADLLDDLRAGPPWFWPGRWNPSFDLHEWYVHHEDVRRANGRPPRDDADLDADLWPVVQRWAKPLSRKANVGIELATNTGEHYVAKAADDATVTVTGRAGELLLLLFGRDCDVEVSGPDAAVAAFDASSLGF